MELSIRADKRFPGFSLTVDFAVNGSRVGIFGPSGSGKSTLFGMLAGLVRPDAGAIRLDGATLFDRERGIDLPPEQRRIGVVFQHAHLFPHLSVRGNLLYGWQRLAPKERRIDQQALIDVLNLAPLLDRGVTTLSGGERQRVALGRAVLASPRLLIMDEPLTGLDESLKLRIIPHLNRVSTEFAIPFLFISHDAQEMRLLTDKVLEFAAGRMVGESSPEALARRRLETGHGGYLNLLRLDDPRPVDDLWSLRWGTSRLVMLEPGNPTGETVVELAAKDVTLFKRHPEASSARNLLPCRVAGLFAIGNRVGVELACGDRTLVAQVVGDAARELGLAVGVDVVAAIKASAFRPLY
jgi:molybdate transport system ATP-binding protein